MPLRLAVEALSVDDVHGRTGDELTWVPVEGAAAGLPAEPGVYLWSTAAEGAVVYIGSATGADGLGKRLRDELRWKAEVAGVEDRAVLRTDYAGHPRVVHDMQAGVQYAATSDALLWERRLLHLSLALTGLWPVLNGAAWWQRGRYDEEARAWAAVER